MERILEAKKVTMRFGGLDALRNVDIHINKREIFGLIGPNGAGKSTFFNVISGFLRPSEGSVLYMGKDITGMPPNRVAAAGLVRTFQGIELFMEFSVRENIEIACHIPAGHRIVSDILGLPGSRTREKKAKERIDDILRLTGLMEVGKELPKNLSHGYQRSLGLAIGLATSPSLLCLDEPVTGMNAIENQRMMETIMRIRDQGITILLVEHSMRTVMGVCDRIAVLDFGNKIAEGTPREIQCNQDVIEAYLGSDYGASA